MTEILKLYLSRLLNISRSSWGKDSLFMILGIIISVGALTLSMLLFQGYESTLSATFKGSRPDIVIRSNGKELTSSEGKELETLLLEFDTEIEAYEKKNDVYGVAKSELISSPIIIESLDLSNHAYNNSLYKFTSKENFSLSKDEIVLGQYLAQELKVEVGDTIDVILPNTIKFSIFGIVQNSISYRVRELYKSGLYEVDKTYAFVNRESIAKLTNSTNWGYVSILLKERNSDYSLALCNKINMKLTDNLADFWAADVLRSNTSLFSALALQKYMIFFLLTIIIVVASFNVVSTLSSIILEKVNEIGILMTIGLSRARIKLLYFLHSFLLTNFGIVSGMLIGTAIAYFLTNQENIGLKGDVYFIDKIVLHPTIDIYLLIYATSLVIIALTIAFSLKAINKLNIIEIIRK